MRALVREQKRRGLADARGRTGDDGNFILESHVDSSKNKKMWIRSDDFSRHSPETTVED
jgi:hypothetical protein